MKKANAEARKEGKDKSYPAWALSNNRQKIASVKRRFEIISSCKEQETVEKISVILDTECRVIENVEAMRLQLIFDSKPSDEVRTVLKKNGFRWSPKNDAWQRQLTDNAKYALRYLEGLQ